MSERFVMSWDEELRAVVATERLGPDEFGASEIVARRIQRKRTKGWRMPVGAVYVGRPSLWGNPYTLDDVRAMHPEVPIDDRRAAAVRLYRRELEHWGLLSDYDYVVSETTWDRIDAEVHATGARNMGEAAVLLQGKNLACFCPLDEPCHADLLLRLANAPLLGGTYMTPKQADLQALSDAATPGPWKAQGGPQEGVDYVVGPTPDDFLTGPLRRANAAYIVALVNWHRETLRAATPVVPDGLREAVKSVIDDMHAASEQTGRSTTSWETRLRAALAASPSPDTPISPLDYHGETIEEDASPSPDTDREAEVVSLLRRLVAVVDAASMVWRDPVPADAGPGGALHDAKKYLAGLRPSPDTDAGLDVLIREGIEAFRLTREYVGEATLPAIPGWSWFDWTEKARARLATPDKDQPV